MTANTINAHSLKRWLAEDEEIALLDVREAGQYGAGHPFFAVPLAYSEFELRLESMVPCASARLVLIDAGDGIAARAAESARVMGYENVYTLKGGVAAWRDAGYELFEGVNTPSKSFGELVEHARATPRISATELNRRIQTRENLVVLDGRPLTEFSKMSIPGAQCCPNGELALRIKALAPDPATTIVINCAGRTRSIIGAQTLIDFGVPNPVFALENGTQGWFLGGFQLDHGKAGCYPTVDESQMDSGMRERAASLAHAAGVEHTNSQAVSHWLADANRSTYLFDIRTREEYLENTPPGFVHAPGGQLVQATDQWVAVRGARIVLLDSDGVRAPVIAGWLKRLGHTAFLLSGGIKAAREIRRPQKTGPVSALKELPLIETGRLLQENFQVFDSRPSGEYLNAHIAGAQWLIRAHVAQRRFDLRRPLVIVGNDSGRAALIARDLSKTGMQAPVYRLPGDPASWKDAGLDIVEAENSFGDAERIDFIFHTHDRHHGNADAARAYLAWETGLVARLDDQERGVFRP